MDLQGKEAFYGISIDADGKWSMSSIIGTTFSGSAEKALIFRLIDAHNKAMEANKAKSASAITIDVGVNTDPIDGLITKLERAVELQKQLTQEPLQTKKATLANLIDVTPVAFGVLVSWNVWWPGKVRVYSKCRHGDEVIEMYGLAVSNSQQSYLINGLLAGQSIECHVRFYNNDGVEAFRSNTVTGKASSDASEILRRVCYSSPYW